MTILLIIGAVFALLFALPHKAAGRVAASIVRRALGRH